MMIITTFMVILFGFTIKKDRKEYFDWLNNKS